MTKAELKSSQVNGLNFSEYIPQSDSLYFQRTEVYLKTKNTIYYNTKHAIIAPQVKKNGK